MVTSKLNGFMYVKNNDLTSLNQTKYINLYHFIWVQSGRRKKKLFEKWHESDVNASDAIFCTVLHYIACDAVLCCVPVVLLEVPANVCCCWIIQQNKINITSKGK